MDEENTNQLKYSLLGDEEYFLWIINYVQKWGFLDTKSHVVQDWVTELDVANFNKMPSFISGLVLYAKENGIIFVNGDETIKQFHINYDGTLINVTVFPDRFVCDDVYYTVSPTDSNVIDYRNIVPKKEQKVRKDNYIK